MRIGIDIRAALHEPAGIGTLAWNIVRRLGPLDQTDEYFLYTDTPLHGYFDEERMHPVIVSAGGNPAARMLWHGRVVADARHRRSLDRFISFGSLQIAALTKNFVVLIVPDLSNLLMPELHVTKSRVASRLLMRRALRHARTVVAISGHTKSDILRYAGGTVEENKIAVAYAACDDIYRVRPADEDIRRVRKQYGLEGKYILSVGTLEPRKNIPALLQAFAALVRNGVPHQLILAGKKGWMYENIFAEVRKLGLDERVKFVGFVPLPDMPSLYAQAEVFVYPSLYEGFGIPPLEAMACGVPVITSNVASLPEVAGDAAILVDPHDTNALSTQLRNLLEDAGLRERLARAGRERATRFSWDSSAEQIHALLQR